MLGALADNNRLPKAPGVIKAFGTIMSAYRGEVTCVVTTAKVCGERREGQREEREGWGREREGRRDREGGRDREWRGGKREREGGRKRVGGRGKD